MSDKVPTMDPARIPVIALPYSEKERAEKRELLVDYDKGKLYVVSAESKDIIFDITANVLESFTEIQASDMKVFIDGIGEVNLQEFVNLVLEKLDQNELEILPDDNATGVFGISTLDGRSLLNRDHIIEVYNFSTAGEGTFPMKIGNVLTWVPNTTEKDPETGGYKNNKILDVGPVEGVGNIQLALTNFQRSKDLSEGSYDVIYPTGFGDEVFITRWIVITGDEIPKLVFPKNTIFEWERTANLYARANHVFELSTWDSGNTWFVTSKVYQVEDTSLKASLLPKDIITYGSIDGVSFNNPMNVDIYEDHVNLHGEIDYNPLDFDFTPFHSLVFNVPKSGKAVITCASTQTNCSVYVGLDKASATKLYIGSVPTEKGTIEVEFDSTGKWYVFFSENTNIYAIDFDNTRVSDDLITREDISGYAFSKEETMELLSWKNE